MAYDQKLDEDDDIMIVSDFKDAVASHNFIDYDGHGYPAKCVNNGDYMMDREILVKPSQVNKIPSDATHIVWFNR